MSGAIAAVDGFVGVLGPFGHGERLLGSPGGARDRARDERHGLEAFVVVDHDQFPIAAAGRGCCRT
jgi:hypothetical protein